MVNRTGKGGFKKGNVPHNKKKQLVKAVANRVRRSLHIEKRFVDVASISQVISTTTQFKLVNPVQIGDQNWNREGKKYMMKYLTLKLVIERNGNDGAANLDYLRVMVVYDRHSKGLVPALSDVIAGYDEIGGGTSTSRSQRNVNNLGRFKILYDRSWDMDNVLATEGTVGTSLSTRLDIMPRSHSYQINKRIRLNLPVNCATTANPEVIASFISGGLYLITSGLNAAAVSQYTLAGNTRLQFEDN